MIWEINDKDDDEVSFTDGDRYFVESVSTYPDEYIESEIVFTSNDLQECIEYAEKKARE